MRSFAGIWPLFLCIKVGDTAQWSILSTLIIMPLNDSRALALFMGNSEEVTINL